MARWERPILVILLFLMVAGFVFEWDRTIDRVIEQTRTKKALECDLGAQVRAMNETLVDQGDELAAVTRRLDATDAAMAALGAACRLPATGVAPSVQNAAPRPARGGGGGSPR